MAQFSTPDYCLCSHDHFVFSYHYQSKKLQKICKIPPHNNSVLGRLKDYLKRSFIARALSNSLGLGHVVQLNNGTIIIIYDKIYRYTAQSNAGVAESVYDIKTHKIAPPLRNGIAIHPVSNNVYFGEYINGITRAVRIIRISENGQKTEVCHTFEVNEIKHVHGIYWDKYRERLWITTGDSDSESSFYYTDDEFKTLHRFNGGDQSWRAVSLGITKNHLVWGMDAGKDAPKEAINHIYRLDLTSGERQQIATIGNPAYHMAQTQSGAMVLGVTYEPGRKQDTLEQASLYFSETGETWHQLLTLPYQAQHLTGRSQYAYIFPPSGIIPDDQLLFTPINIMHYDAKALLLKISY
ncbi:hypothetical protein [Litorilituus lipolyticus]|uniref:Exo-alpha-sialidase n=1 Tax=Litorilituus lipolyticus TaxID=2491017 RepID=A0A502KTE9_9GAMM|nr:hypothetical protein [Litorilituus lipolyticus]TPH13301.1 hypothetical protein EPA86_13995 [Litorilituus lipolyticus]